MSATTSSSGEAFARLVREAPMSHPAPFSVRYFGYSHPPGPHLLDFYDSVHDAVTKTDAMKQIARFLPRGHGKTESTTVVVPTWMLVGLDPSLSVVIISHKRSIANERAKKAVRHISELAPQAGIEIIDESATEIRLGPGMENKEPSLSAMSIKSDWEGRHFDVIIWDDIATLKNQTTADRGTILEQFRDRDNLISPDPKIPGGGVQLVIGTRKHDQDIYREEILKRNEYEWDGNVARSEGQPGWEAKTFRAIGDWSVIENEEYDVHATDGNTYGDLTDVPDEENIINDGIRPTEDVQPLWPQQKSAAQLVTEALTSYTPAWKRENQQDTAAFKGNHWEFDWLEVRESLPKDWDKYQWYAGLDWAKTPDAEDAARNDSDYWALAVIAYDRTTEVSYLMDVWRKRGMTQHKVASDGGWVDTCLIQYPVAEVIVESNFVGGEIADLLAEETGFRVRKKQSRGDKDDRLEAKVGNRIQQGKLQIVLDDEKFESWIQDEYLAFPNYHKIDRTDAIEIALRKVEGEYRVVEEDELSHLTFE